jgi:hypothetical protein
MKHQIKGWPKKERLSWNHCLASSLANKGLNRAERLLSLIKSPLFAWNTDEKTNSGELID